MGVLIWSSDYEFGISEIDKQHKQWLSLWNTFYENLESENNKEQLLKILDKAIDYTQYHFNKEESFMSDIGYPSLLNQKEQHKEIADKIYNLRKKLETNQPIVMISITNEFKLWFNKHILIEDKKYAEMYKKLKHK